MSNIINEIWKPIAGFEGLYEVSNLGRVRSLDRVDDMGRLRKGKIRKPNLDSRGYYLMVNLWKNGTPSMWLVHRLVARAFLPNEMKHKEVNHKDENKTNNCVSNLEWCDHIYNNNYGSKAVVSKGSQNSNSKLTDDLVRSIREEAKTTPIPLLAEKYGLSRSHTYHVVNGTRWGWLG